MGTVKDESKVKSEKRRSKAKLYSFHKAMRSNTLLTEELKTSHKHQDIDQQRHNRLTDHVKSVMGLKTKQIEKTNRWMNNNLNRCLLILERGRHMQVVKPYFHAPGKPLTPYHTKKQRAEMRDKRDEVEEQPKSVFIHFKETKRFSKLRDNGHVKEVNKYYGID